VLAAADSSELCKRGVGKMNELVRALRIYAARLTAVVVILAIYGFARLPSLSTSEREQIASRFSFERLPLPEVAGRATRSLRAVHPERERISSWISAVGAS